MAANPWTYSRSEMRAARWWGFFYGATLGATAGMVFASAVWRLWG